MRRAGDGFWSGVGAGCAFVAVTLLARAIFRVPTLPELVQDRLVVLLPGRLFAFLLVRLLYLGKPLLFGSLLLLTLVIGGLVGMAIARWSRPARGALILWLAIGLALLPLAGQGVFGGSFSLALITLLASAAYAGAFTFFSGQPPLDRSTPSAAPISPALTRRRLLAGGALGLVSAGLAWRVIGRLPELPPRSEAAVPSGGAAQQTGSPLAVEGASATPGLPPAITPTARFYVVSKNLLDPDIKADGWAVRIDGLVSRPLTLKYSDITSMSPVQANRTLECISNEVGGDLISTGQWTGVRLADLLQPAELKPAGSALIFTCQDGYTSSLPLAWALLPDTLLAYQLNGAPLSAKHGYPARVLGVGTYGMKNPKWITRIEVASAERPGYWQQQGWDAQGIVQTMASITSPDDGAALSSAPTTISGIAFAGSRGITRVEVSTDAAASWSDARLLPSLGSDAWTFWQFSWIPGTAGPYSILARATDGTGTIQPARRTDPFPVGATGYHQVRVRVSG